MANINRFNFLRWDNNPAISDTTNIPNFFIQDRCVLPYMPVMVPGEQLSFYINSKDGLDFDNPELLKLKFFKEGFESPEIDLQIDDLDDVTYNLYATLNIPTLNDGIYRLKIVNDSNTTLLQSNFVRVMNSGFDNITTKVKFRNLTNHFGVRYGFLPSFYQEFRLHITEVTQDYEDELEKYMSVTTGRVRNLLSMPQKFHIMQTYHFDKEAHEATAVMCNSSFIEINGQEYRLKTAYKPEAINIQGKSKGIFEIYNLAFATVNKCG